MSFDDYDDHGASNLGPEAFIEHSEPTEINDSWIANAKDHEQTDAMRTWWYARYVDPAHDTPYNGREGGYLYIHGGPYEPSDELHTRFGPVVNGDVIQELVEELYQDVGDSWAPVQYARDFEDDFDIEPTERQQPVKHLCEALQGDCNLLASLAEVQIDAAQVLLRHAFISVVAALETYLWETTKYWLTADTEVLTRLITRYPKFRERPLKLGQIFERHAKLLDEVNDELRKFVWHRLDEVKPLMQIALEASLPDEEELMAQVVVRHDLVHRNGRKGTGEVVELSQADYRQLERLVLTYTIAIEEAVASKWPDNGFNQGLLELRRQLADITRCDSGDGTKNFAPDF